MRRYKRLKPNLNPPVSILFLRVQTKGTFPEAVAVWEHCEKYTDNSI